MGIQLDRGILYDPPTNDLATATTGTNVTLSGTLTAATVAATGGVTAGTTIAATGALSGSAVTVTGAVTGASLAITGGVDNAELGADVARRNLLVNGGFEIWQRGAGAFTSDAVYTADRWLIQLGASSTISVSRNSANADAGSLYCAAITYTHSATSYLRQKIEDHYQLRSRSVTFSCRIATATASAVRLSLYDDVTGHTMSSYHTGGGTWETLSASATISATATQVRVYIWIEASTTVYADNAMLVMGSIAATYAPLQPAEELSRCHRYYEVFGGTAVYEGLANGFCSSTTAAICIRPFVQKGGTPSFNIGTAANYAVDNGVGTPVAATVVSAGQIGNNSVQFTVTVAAGLTAGRGTRFMSNGTVAGTISCEYNP